MTEFEIIDDKLVMVCEHEWGKWISVRPENGASYQRRHCKVCGITQELRPPSKLPAKSSFKLFLADWAARDNK